MARSLLFLLGCIFSVGVVAQDDCELEQFYQDAGLSSGSIRTMFRDNQDKFIVSAYNNLYIFDGEKFKELELKNEIGEPITTKSIRQIEEFNNGKYYINIAFDFYEIDFNTLVVKKILSPLSDISLKDRPFYSAHFIGIDSNDFLQYVVDDSDSAYYFTYNAANNEVKKRTSIPFDSHEKAFDYRVLKLSKEKKDWISYLERAGEWNGDFRFPCVVFDNEYMLFSERDNVPVGHEPYSPRTPLFLKNFANNTIHTYNYVKLKNGVVKPMVLMSIGRLCCKDMIEINIQNSVSWFVYVDDLLSCASDTLPVQEEIEMSCLKSGYLGDVFLDDEDVLWLGANPSGLFKYKFKHHNINNITPEEGASGSFVRTIFTADSSHVLIGYEIDGVDVYNTNTGEVNSTKISKQFYSAFDFLKTNSGTVYVAGPDGIGRFNKDFSTIYHVEVVNSGELVLKPPFIYMVQLSDSLFLSSCSESAYLLKLSEENSFFTYPLEALNFFQNDLNDRIFFIKEKADNSAYIFYNHQLSVLKFDPQNLTSYEEEVLLRIDSVEIKDMLQWTDSTWYLATTSGLYHYTQHFDSLLQYYSKELPNKLLYSVIPDNDGNIWCSSNYGINCFTPKTQSFKFFDHSSGILKGEYNTSAFAKDVTGKLYFGGITGTTSFYPKDLNYSTYKANTYISSILINDIEQRELQGFKMLTHTENTITIQLKSTSLLNPKKVKYAYLLEGVDENWIENSNGLIRYPNLPPKKYTLKYKSSNSDGIWGEIKTLGFSVEPPFWLTWWFIMLECLFIGGSILFSIRYLSQRKLKMQLAKSEQEKKLLMERQRISRDLHDHVGADLAFLSGSLDQGDNSKVELNEIKEGVNVAIEHLRESVWVLQKEAITLTDFVLKSKSFMIKHIKAAPLLNLVVDYDLKKDIELTPAISIQLFRLLQESVNNCVKYSNATQLKVKFDCKDRLLLLSVADNGFGFDVSKAMSLQGNQHYGLTNMKSRVDSLGGKFIINSSINEGTSIEIEIPLA